MFFVILLVSFLSFAGSCAGPDVTLADESSSTFELVRPESTGAGWYEKDLPHGGKAFAERHRFFGGIVKRVVLREDYEPSGKTPDAIIDLSDDDANETFLQTFCPCGDPVLRTLGATKGSVIPAGEDAQSMYSTLIHQMAKLKNKQLGSFYKFLHELHLFFPNSLRSHPISVKIMNKLYLDGSFTLLVKTIEGQELFVRCACEFDAIDCAYVVNLSVEKGFIEKYSHIIYGLTSMLFEIEKNRMGYLWAVGCIYLLGTSFSVILRLLLRPGGLNLGFVHLGAPGDPQNPFYGHDVKINQIIAATSGICLLGSLLGLNQLYQSSKPLLED
ncbi:hypothetical protein FJ366_00185 [Candidatus Dependentiae bacterium]|nr:hypothetical protein [Candidatus Dependentiae bacterium]